MPRKKRVKKPEPRETYPVQETAFESSEAEKHIDVIREEVTDTGKDVDEIKEEVAETSKDVDEIKEDVDEIKEEVADTGKDVEEIKEDVDEIKEDMVEIAKKQDSILKRISEKLSPSRFNINDVAQQIVGAIILSSPLAVTSEVWGLAQELDATRLTVILGVTLLFDVLLIYFTAYRKESEVKVINFIPARLLSMILVSYLTTGIMLYIFGVIGNEITDPAWALRMIIFIGLFANVGAGTADILK